MERETGAAPSGIEPDVFQTESLGVRRRRLTNMGISYAMGTFNDNFFKQAGLLLAAAAGLIGIQGLATLLFALPFVAFSAWTGWLADRMPKKGIIVWSKVMELAAMGLGLWSLYVMSWPGVVFVVFFMGLQSTFFSPAINGSIPENFSANDVPKVNAILKLATTATVLLGIALAGPFLDFPAPASTSSWLPEGPHAFGRLALGGFAILVSVVGLITALGIRGRVPKKHSAAPFPFLGPIHSATHALECHKGDRPLFYALAGEAFFYFISSFVILCITNLGKGQLNLSMTVTSMLSVALMLGVCAGSLWAGRWPVRQWQRHTSASGMGMGLGLALSSLAPLLPVGAHLPWLFTIFVLTGVCGGLYLIPIVSCIQVRPSMHEKGKILGVSNFGSFAGIMISGPLFSFLLEPSIRIGLDGPLPGFNLGWGLTPAMLLGGAGIVGIVFMIFLGRKLAGLESNLAAQRPGFLGRFLRVVLALRYRVRVTGLDAIAVNSAKKEPILFLPNHPALIDPVIVYSQLASARPRPLSDENRLAGFLGRLVRLAVHPVTIPDLSQSASGEARREVEEGLARVIGSLRQGDSVLLYPAGRIYRGSREVLGGNSGTARILHAIPNLRVVLVRTTGLWGSSFGFAAAGKSPSLARVLLRGLLTLLANGLFFTPRRRVEIEFVESPDLPRQADKKVLNAWLERFYNEKEQPALGVPRFFWQGSKPFALPEPQGAHGHSTGREAINPAVRERVYEVLREAANLPDGFALRDDMLLNADLDLDSLAMMEVAVQLEEEFSLGVLEPDQVLTVGDCVLAAAGLLQSVDAEQKPVPPTWFAPSAAKDLRGCAQGGNIPEAFLRLARFAPNEPMAGEWGRITTRREILIAALVLSRHIKAYPGKRIGLMLPATPAALGVWLAAMLAGKETVFLNWTVGEANLRHCVKIAEIGHVLTSSALLDRLERQNLPLSRLPVAWVPLERLGASLRLREKLRGLLLSRLLRSFKSWPIRDTAAILFTSGSEAMPKGVPLSHTNLLTNGRDAVEALRLNPNEKLVAMLPPFHSFGLLVDLVIPLGFGLRAGFYPNPTEPAKVAALIRDFKLTVLPATPTFLEAILERAKGTGSLDSLHYAFAGAEKCPERVYRSFAAQCPQAALCEGYGITECSPIVALNRPDSTRAGTIGYVLASIQAAVVREEDGAILGPADPGISGMLLVRGPSIFSGYLGDVASPFVEYDGQTWYRTGDLVSRDQTGRITFVGRLKRFVKKGGEMISLPQIETILLEAFSARPDAPAEGAPLAIEASPDEHGAEVTLFTPMRLDLGEVNAALRKAGLTALHSVKRIVPIPAIPLLGTGKTDYRSLKGML